MPNSVRSSDSSLAKKHAGTPLEVSQKTPEENGVNGIEFCSSNRGGDQKSPVDSHAIFSGSPPDKDLDIRDGNFSNSNGHQPDTLSSSSISSTETIRGKDDPPEEYYGLDFSTSSYEHKDSDPPESSPTNAVDWSDLESLDYNKGGDWSRASSVSSKYSINSTAETVYSTDTSQHDRTGAGGGRSESLRFVECGKNYRLLTRTDRKILKPLIESISGNHGKRFCRAYLIRPLIQNVWNYCKNGELPEDISEEEFLKGRFINEEAWLGALTSAPIEEGKAWKESDLLMEIVKLNKDSDCNFRISEAFEAHLFSLYGETIKSKFFKASTYNFYHRDLMVPLDTIAFLDSLNATLTQKHMLWLKALEGKDFIAAHQLLGELIDEEFNPFEPFERNGAKDSLAGMIKKNPKIKSAFLRSIFMMEDLHTIGGKGKFYELVGLLSDTKKWNGEAWEETQNAIQLTEQDWINLLNTSFEEDHNHIFSDKIESKKDLQFKKLRLNVRKKTMSLILKRPGQTLEEQAYIEKIFAKFTCERIRRIYLLPVLDPNIIKQHADILGSAILGLKDPFWKALARFHESQKVAERDEVWRGIIDSLSYRLQQLPPPTQLQNETEAKRVAIETLAQQVEGENPSQQLEGISVCQRIELLFAHAGKSEFLTPQSQATSENIKNQAIAETQGKTAELEVPAPNHDDKNMTDPPGDLEILGSNGESILIPSPPPESIACITKDVSDTETQRTTAEPETPPISPTLTPAAPSKKSIGFAGIDKFFRFLGERLSSGWTWFKTSLCCF